jgi:glucose/arabinose dehydrogenase
MQKRAVYQMLPRLHSVVVTTIITIILIITSACSATSDGTTNEPAANGTGSSTARAAGATSTPASDSGTVKPTASPIETRVLATGLEVPWGLAFLPDGRALVSERKSGILRIITVGGQVEQVQKLSSTNRGEGGLLGIALSPNYAIDKLVYAYYTTAHDNRIVRFRLGEHPVPILTGIPAAGNHNGGRIAFGLDGMLYVGTGDAAQKPLAQNLQSLGGKILRMTADGNVPDDNPFPNSLVYSYGHRNVQGLAWDAKGQLYASEFGQNTFDEVNRIRPGRNYGWPIVEGEGNDNRFVNPITTFATSEASPSGIAILKNGAIPQWEGNIFVAGLRGQRLWRLTITANGTLMAREALYEGIYGRLRHVVQAPDGALWLLTSNRDGRGNPVAQDDRIIRIGPANG